MSAPAEKASSWRTALQDVWSGFSEPSRLGLLATAVGFAVMLAVALWFFSEQTLSGPWGKYLARSQLDGEGLATHRALQLGATIAKHPRLIVLGTSATANALANETALAEAIARETGETWEVHLLTTPRQSALDQMTLIETALGPGNQREQLVVIAIGSSLLRQSWTVADLLKYEHDGRIGLRSQWADEAVRSLGGSPRHRFGFYPLDNYHFVAANGFESLLRLLLHTPAVRKIDTYAPAIAIPPEKRSRRAVSDQIRRGLEDRSAYFRLLTQLLDHLARMERVHVVQIEEPTSSDFLKETGLLEAKSEMTSFLQTYGKEHGVPYLPIITDSNIPDEAYHDDLHIYGDHHQSAIRNTLAKHLAPLIKDWQK